MESRKREKLMNNCNHVDQFPHRKPVQQFREARKMPLQLFIFKSNHLYTGIKPFCGILMFVADFNSLPLRLRCSVITTRHRKQKRWQRTTIHLQRYLQELGLLVAPQSWSLSNYPSCFCSFGVVKCPATNEPKLISCILLKSQPRGRAWGHHQLGCISLSHSLSHVATPELLLPLERWGLQWKESSVLYYFQLKGVIRRGKTFIFPARASAIKLLEDFRGKNKGRKQRWGKKRKQM